MTASIVAPCDIRDADPDEAAFCDRVVAQAGLDVVGDVEPAVVRLALREGQVIGFASITADRSRSARLKYVFVHHHARRHGIGRALVHDLCLIAADSRRLRIEAHPAAESFFVRIGARREGTLPPDHRVPFCRPVFSAP